MGATTVFTSDVGSMVIVGPVGHGGDVIQGQPLAGASASSAAQVHGQPQVQVANQGVLPLPGLTLSGRPAAHPYHRRRPNIPGNAHRVRGPRGGTSEYITTVERDPAAPGLQAPGLSCTDA